MIVSTPVLAQEGRSSQRLTEVDTIIVTGKREQPYAVDSAVSATKTDAPIMKVPQIVNVVPAQVLLDQQVQSLTEVLRNVSGITQTNGAFFGDTLKIRGFGTDGAFLRDGYPRQNELALALREVGRVERTLFMIDWILDAGLQRQAQIGLNKGEAHHALKRAISFHRRGEIRDRSGEGQHCRIAGMNLLAAIIIFWNTMKLGDVVSSRAADGAAVPRHLLAHVSPLGWEHINLTGEYRWPKSLDPMTARASEARI